MTNNTVFRLSMAVIVAIVILGWVSSFFTPINHAGPNTSKESTPVCTQKNNPAIKSEADFEPLSGKFFSFLPY